LERAAVYPDVTLGLRILHEGPTDAREKAVGLSFSVPLPLFNRNRSGIGRAATELAQVQVERQAAERDVRAETRALWKRAEDLGARVRRLQAAVLPRLEENRRLSLTAFRAGEIGLTELLLVDRQVLDGRRDLLEARTDYRLVRIALEAAAGWPSPDEKSRF
jgi:cobalt-zinc-cadmium efflux system outer membrane protein